MLNDATGIFLALLSFAMTFALARGLRKWLRTRKAAKEEELRLKGQSRQVRRARERAKR